MPSTPFAESGEKCEHCVEPDSLTHMTSEHDENYVAKLEKCDDCGSEPGEDCHPDCPWAYCPQCGRQNEECVAYGTAHFEEDLNI
jgi:hypothetical protein